MAREGLGSLLGGIAGEALGALIPGGAGKFLKPVTSGIGAYAGNAIQNKVNAKGVNQPGQQKGGFFKGKPGGFEQVSPYTQDQQDIFKLLGQQGLSQLQNPYAGFDPIRERALSGFQNNTIPSLAERFSQASNSRITSPAFTAQSQLAATDLQSQLAALEAQYGMQNQGNALQMLGLGLSPQYQNAWSNPEPGFNQGLMQLLQAVAPAIGQAGVQGFAGYMGNKPGISQGKKDFWNSISYSNALNGMKGTP